MSFEIEERLSAAATLPSRVYRDPGLFDVEKERIFSRSWQLVGRLEQAARPGDYFTAQVADEELLVVRGSDGTLRALSNVCRHRAGPVAKGAGSARAFTCGYHGWSYGLDGRLLGTPEMEGIEGFDRSACRLPAFGVQTWLGLVFVSLDPAARPLAEELGPLVPQLEEKGLSQMRPAFGREWTLGCNWKVYVDNYLEGYHIPVVHPGLMKELDYAAYRTELSHLYSLQVSPIKKTAEGRLRGGAEDDARYYWIFPNLMLNVYPDNFSTNLVVPVGPERTLTVFEWFFPDAGREDVKAAVAKTVEFSDEIQREDIAICEAVQRGLKSRTYVRGRFSPRRESGVHHFHRLWAGAMAG